jgi:hypothetical protein
MFPRDYGHRSRNSMVAAVIWLTATEYLFHRWKRRYSLFHRSWHDRHGGCLIRNRRCLLYRCTWSHPSFCGIHVGHLSIDVPLVIVSFLSVCVFLVLILPFPLDCSFRDWRFDFFLPLVLFPLNNISGQKLTLSHPNIFFICALKSHNERYTQFGLLIWQVKNIFKNSIVHTIMKILKMVLWHHICYIVKHNVSYNLVWTNPVFVNVSSVYIESLKKTFIQF